MNKPINLRLTPDARTRLSFCLLISLFCIVRDQPAYAAWFVNDTSATGDSYTFAPGYDTQPGSANSPFRTVSQALKSAKSGDTIYIDAGLYTETVVIDTDYISLIGKDSNTTVIDPPGANWVSGLYGIYAANRTGLAIKDLGVMGANIGIRLENVDRSTVSGDSVTSCGNTGISLVNGSDTNTLIGNMAVSNSSYGIYLSSSSNNALSGNTAG